MIASSAFAFSGTIANIMEKFFHMTITTDFPELILGCRDAHVVGALPLVSSLGLVEMSLHEVCCEYV